MTAQTPSRSPARALTIASVAMACDLDPAVNRARIAERVARICTDRPDVRLVHFGETILGWYFKKGETAAYHRRIAEPITGPSVERLAAVAREHGVYLSFGMTEKAGEAIHNSHVLLGPDGRVVAVHRKLCRKDPVFAPGERRITTAEIDGVRLALLICADVQDFQVLRAIRRTRADLVLGSLADYGTDLRLARMIGCLLDTRAITANRVGQEGPRNWPGLIVDVDRSGRIRRHRMGGEDVLVETLAFRRDRFFVRAVRRIAGAGRIVLLSLAMMVRPHARPRRKVPQRPSATV